MKHSFVLLVLSLVVNCLLASDTLLHVTSHYEVTVVTDPSIGGEMRRSNNQ